MSGTAGLAAAGALDEQVAQVVIQRAVHTPAEPVDLLVEEDYLVLHYDLAAAEIIMSR